MKKYERPQPSIGAGQNDRFILNSDDMAKYVRQFPPQKFQIQIQIQLFI